MKAGVLYSGGKDSSLMALILKRMGFEVELVTINFGIYKSWLPALESATNLGFSHRVLKLDDKILRKGVDLILEEGFPNHGINHIHHEVLELMAKEYSVIADGTRRDDRTPKLNDNEIRSFEDRNKVEYINLQSFGHKTIKNIAFNLFEVTNEESNRDNNSDYEVEIRCLIDEIKGENYSNKIFPKHYQTRVTGWKNKDGF
jgi:hypothetical protein